MGNGGIIAIFPSMGWPKGLKRGVSAIKTETTMASVTPKVKRSGMTPATEKLLNMLEALMKAKLHRNPNSSVFQLATEAEDQLMNLIIPDSEFQLKQETELLEYLTSIIDERNGNCASQREKGLG